MLGRSRNWDLDILMPQTADNPGLERPCGNHLLLSQWNAAPIAADIRTFAAKRFGLRRLVMSLTGSAADHPRR
jgi:hypothetical protein